MKCILRMNKMLLIGGMISLWTGQAAWAQTTELVSLKSDGSQFTGNAVLTPGHAMSQGGEFLVFIANDSGQLRQLYRVDLRESDKLSELVSRNSSGEPANSLPGIPSVAQDGSVVFQSNASNLIDGQTAGGIYHVSSSSDLSFVASGGSSILSQTGRFIAFQDNITRAMLKDISNDDPPIEVFGYGQLPAVSDDGKFVAFLTTEVIGGKTIFKVMMKNMVTGELTTIAETETASFGRPIISGDGNTVVFDTRAKLEESDGNFNYDVYVYRRGNGLMRIPQSASQGTSGYINLHPSVSRDGKWVAFGSNAKWDGEAHNGVLQVVVYNTTTGEATIESKATDGSLGNNNSDLPHVSEDGRFVAFQSTADNLVIDDSNSGADVFLRDRGPQEPEVEVISFIGFQSPINNLPISNSAKAGQTIPIKWQLKDTDDAFIRDLDAVAENGMRAEKVACSAADTALSEPVEVVASGSTTLRYDATAEQFVYNWKTPKALAKRCAVLTVPLRNGDEHSARFNFK